MGKPHKYAAKRKAANSYTAALQRKPRPILWRLGRAIKALIWVILVVHIYAIALRFMPVPYTINMLRDDSVTKRWIPIENISPHLIYAVIAAEDSRFCTHNGIDWKATKDAFADNQSGKRRRGASGLSQQTAKNVFFWNGGGYIRKIGEAYFAYLIDFVWGKKRVMEVYLNIAEWGDGLYGAEAAARKRFGKSARDLSPREAALLAAVLPSPNKWRVDPPGPYVMQRAATLQQRAAVTRNEGYAACVLPAK